MQNTWKKVIAAYFHGWRLALLVCGFVFSLALLYVPSGYLFSITAYVLVVVGISYRVNKIKNSAWIAFAVSNGWSFDEDTPLATIVPPSLQFGYNQFFSPVIQVQLSEIVFDLLGYSTYTGSGRHQQDHSYTIGTVSLPRAFPHILLRSKKVTVMHERDFVNAEELRLEGDFEDYFSLQVEKGQEVAALEVLTPDIMQKLLDSNTAEDIEIVGSNVYFILNHDRRDYRDISVFMDSIFNLSTQLLKSL